MGGFAAPIAQGIADHVTPIIEHLKENLGSVERNMRFTPQGSLLADSFKTDYLHSKAQATGELAQKALATAKADPAKPQVDLSPIHSTASKIARQAWLGPKDTLGALAVASVEKTHGLAAAENLSNSIAFLLKDYEMPSQKAISRGQANVPFSSFKRNVSKAGVALSNEKPSFEPASPVENKIKNGIYATFSPLLVVPHLQTVFNGLFGSEPHRFLQGLARPLGESLNTGMSDFEALVHSGAFNETFLNDVKEWNKYEATGHPPIAGSGVAHLLSKLFYQPGFQGLRKYTLLSTANIGKMTAEDVARRIGKGLTPQLAFQAREFGLDPIKLSKNGGVLDPDDLSQAVYQFVNTHVFLDNSLSRSRALQSNPVGRLLGTYHSYVTRQSKLMGKAMFRDFKERGPLSVVKNLAVGAVLMPILGEGTKIIQETIRGQDAGGDLHRDLKDLRGDRGADRALFAYVGALSHVGAFGVYAHSLRGTLTHSILQDAAGPLFGSLANLGQDVAGAMQKDFTDHPRDITKRNPRTGKHWAPVKRDLLYDTPGISLLAQFLSHRMYPTSKDNPRKDPVHELYEYMRKDDDEKNK